LGSPRGTGQQKRIGISFIHPEPFHSLDRIGPNGIGLYDYVTAVFAIPSLAGSTKIKQGDNGCAIDVHKIFQKRSVIGWHLLRDFFGGQ
jgi:hypothetical protein